MFVEGRFRGKVSDMKPVNGGHMCLDKCQGWGCTRPAGHPGNHRAGTLDGQWAAEWDDDRSTDDRSIESEPSDFFDSIGL